MRHVIQAKLVHNKNIRKFSQKYPISNRVGFSFFAPQTRGVMKKGLPMKTNKVNLGRV